MNAANQSQTGISSPFPPLSRNHSPNGRLVSKGAILGLSFLIWTLLAGCIPARQWPSFEIPSRYVEVSAGETFSQTFVPRLAGLEGMALSLEPASSGSGEIVLRIGGVGIMKSDEAVARLPIATVNSRKPYVFSIKPLGDSSRQGYTAQVSVEGAGSVKVGVAPGGTYLDGALSREYQPLDAQLSFSLRYHPYWMMIGLLSEVWSWSGPIISGTFLFLMPGLALLTASWPKRLPLNPLSRVGLSAGISLAIYPTLFLLSHLVDFQPGKLAAWGPASIGLLYMVWKARGGEVPKPATARWLLAQITYPRIGLLASIVALLFTRFYPLIWLDLPLFGDSYQHTVITQLLVDHSGIFDSWQPYADLETFTYHFGFHTLTAVYHWVTGTPAAQAVLWVGQILNVLAVIALYPLSRRLSPSPWTGTATLIVAGFLSPMPMFYINWGRYTQLAGQVILPAVIFLIWQTIEQSAHRWQLTVSTWITLAGLALTHYRVSLLAVLFVPALLLVAPLVRRNLRGVVPRLIWIGLGAGLLFLPWFLRVFSGKIMALLASQLTTPASAVSVWQETNQLSLDLLARIMPLPLGFALLVSLLWTIIHRRVFGVLMAFWSLIVILAANPQWLRLPGAGVLTNFTIALAAYIIAGIMVGASVGDLIEWGKGKLLSSPRTFDHASGKLFRPEGRARTINNLVLMGVLVLTIWGATRRVRDLDVYAHALATRPDIRAAAWIRENTPPDARFLVNSFFSFGDTLIAGSDGGWWLPWLAMRATSQPPLNYGSEEGIRQDYRLWTNRLVRRILDQGIDHPDTRLALRERGITHVYIGQRHGVVNNPGLPLLDPDRLLASQHFVPVYHEDRVWVFQLQAP